MQIYLDSADIAEIRKAVGYGIIRGVTTNPSSLTRQKEDDGVLGTIFGATGKLPVSVQISPVSTNADEMHRRARHLFIDHLSIICKLPLTADGLIACSQLSRLNIPCNMTLCFSTAQAILAAAAGAYIVSIFVSRQDDIGGDGIDTIRKVREIYDRMQEPKPLILAASIRSVDQVVQAALAGADICTVSLVILEKMMQHPLTDSGLAKFAEDWRGGDRS